MKNGGQDTGLEQMRPAETALSVEESFGRLDEMVKKLEDPAVTLEESFRLYQEGMKLLKDVSATLDGYEKKIRVLTEDGGTEELHEEEA